MKKGMALILLLAILLATTAHAVSYGSKITRIQTFPGEKIKQEIEDAKANINAQDAEAMLKLEELTGLADQLKSDIDKLTTDSASARTENNVQLSNMMNAIDNLKTQLNDVRDSVKDIQTLKTDLPPMLEEPREIITPPLLIDLSAINILLLTVLILLVLFVRKQHESSHKMTPHGHPELHDYIKQHVSKGININTIKQQLISHDWDPQEVDEAIRVVKES